MAQDKYSAGLDDQDELSQFPSPVSPLASAGLDPDAIRANPDMLASIANPNIRGADNGTPPPMPAAAPGPVSMPGGNELDQLNSPAASTPAPPATPAATPDLASYGQEGLGLLTQNMKSATEATGTIPTTNPEIEKLEAQRAKLATPPAIYDPQTGKMVSQAQEYDPKTGQMITVNPKPSTGTRIWRGIRSGLVGLATGGIPGALVGALEPQSIAGGARYGAPSTAFQRAEQQRETNLGATDQAIDTSFKSWKDQVDAAKASASEYRANAALGKDITTGSKDLQTVDVEKAKAANEATRLHNEDPAVKNQAALALGKDEFDQRGRMLDSDPKLRNLSYMQKMLYRLNGKVPEPQQPTEGEITAQAAATALSIFKAKNGGRGPQTLEDFNAIQQTARGDLGKGNKTPNLDAQINVMKAKKARAIQEANADYASKFNVETYQRALQAAQNAFEDEAETIGQLGPHVGVSVDKKGNVTWKPEAQTEESAAPAPQQAAPKPPPLAPPPGATHTGISKKDNKLHYTNADGTADYGPAE